MADTNVFLLPNGRLDADKEMVQDDGYGGGNGGGGDMLQRIKDLEKDVQQMKTDIAVMRSNYATKTDVSDAKNSIILWVVGAVVFAQLIPAIPKVLEIFFHK
ncbi:hypothetical protein N5I36_08995 [Klebsiella aerogenes]|uniref:hypothetical protein n=1 Tax=Klebsiella aerogenes TaxID=548 RepID=UPI0022454C83|nr:hypothetical protein [Klebsiella aerogenes]MCW9252094.1 hypothetical protein [Klebsiella aerogenes]